MWNPGLKKGVLVLEHPPRLPLLPLALPHFSPFFTLACMMWSTHRCSGSMLAASLTPLPNLTHHTHTGAAQWCTMGVWAMCCLAWPLVGAVHWCTALSTSTCIACPAVLIYSSTCSHAHNMASLSCPLRLPNTGVPLLR